MGEIFEGPELSRDEQKTKDLNMIVLKRRDEFVEDILVTAPHVVMYEYNDLTCQWNRKDIEGALFVVKRTKLPRFQLVVMNRRSTDNLVEDILGNLEFEMEIPYFMFRCNNQKMNGIWFYQPHSCQAVFDIFNRLLFAYKKAPPKQTLSSSKSEYSELEAVPTEEIIGGPLEPKLPFFSNAMSAPFRDFFSQNKSSNDGRTESATPVSQVTPHGRPHHTSPHQIPSTSYLFPPPSPHNIPSSFFTNTPQGFETPIRPSNFTPPSSHLSQFFNQSPSPSPPTFQSNVGAPFLQPFPPRPPLSLAQNLNQNSNLNLNSSLNLNLNERFNLIGNRERVLSRESVRDALVRLAQNEDYVEMVYQEILKAHNQDS